MWLFRCWVCCIKSGEKDTGDKPHNGRPSMAATAEIKGCHITASELCPQQEFENWWLWPLSENLAAKKMCTWWVLYMLSDKQKTAQNNICAELFQRSGKDGDACLSRIITGDETLVHHYDQLMKLQSVEWYHQLSPCKIQLKAQTSAGTAMASVI